MIVFIVVAVLLHLSHAQVAEYRIQQLENRLAELEQRLTSCGCPGNGGSTYNCPPGWQYYNQYCWLYDDTPHTWMEAREACRLQGADLASITSSDENSHAYALRRKKLKKLRDAKQSNDTSHRTVREVSVANCFEKHPQSAIYQPTGQHVMTKNTAEECMVECTQAEQVHGYGCKSIMFYSQSYNCVLNTEDHTTATLYSLDSNSYGYVVDYYQNNCNKQPPTDGQSDETCFTKEEVMNLVGYADKVLQGLTLSQCMHSCQIAETEHLMMCNSFVFYPRFGDCIMNTATRNSDGVILAGNPDTDYYENVCNKNKQCFKEFQGMSLVGYADTSLKASDVNHCMDLCRQKWWQCSSLIYYPMYNDCILNTETRQTKPDSFHSEQQGESVSYYDRIECSENCGSKFVDVMFIVDGSGSIGPYDFIKLKDFVKIIVDAMDVGTDKTHVGMVQFTHDATTEFSMDSYSTNQNVKNAIDRVQWKQAGHTDIANALQYTLDYELKPSRGDREGVKTVVILLTDGFNTIPNQHPSGPAQAMRDRGADTFAIGATDAVSEDELLKVAGDPGRVFKVSDFDQLKKLKNEIVGQICTEHGIWIGLTDEAYEGNFQWCDGSQITFSGWADFKPSDKTHSANCVLMQDDPPSTWTDIQCEDKQPYLCKLKPIL